MSSILFISVSCLVVYFLNLCLDSLFVLYSYIIYEFRHTFRAKLDIPTITWNSWVLLNWGFFIFWWSFLIYIFLYAKLIVTMVEERRDRSFASPYSLPLATALWLIQHNTAVLCCFYFFEWWNNWFLLWYLLIIATQSLVYRTDMWFILF